MVNEEIVLNTIKKMQEAGLSETIITSTLTDLGLSGEQVQSYLIRARGGAVTAALSPRPAFSSPSSLPPSSSKLSSDDHEAIASRTNEMLQQSLAEKDALLGEESLLKDNITHLALEQHGEQLKETHNAVVELHDKIDSTDWTVLNSRLTNVNTRVEALTSDIKDIKAMSAALQTLLQKILETNQQLLFEMKKK